jgi:hypothetical protein
MDNSHHKADSGRKYSLYFDLLREKIEQYQVETCHIVGYQGAVRSLIPVQLEGLRANAAKSTTGG